MNRFQDKLIRFMQGRNGMDALAKAESKGVWIILIINIILSFFVRFRPFAILFQLMELLLVVLIVHMYYRVFSKNIGKRYEENSKYLQWNYRMQTKFGRQKKELEQRKIYRFYSCPTCKQRVRVPKGRGKILITCPKCRGEFQRRS